MLFEQYRFKYKFRDYQEKALNEIHEYIDDDKIHIVAPPGAGKTILALQLMIELNKPTLICVPTITLREQWIKRFKEDFISENKDNIISNDIYEPSLITVCTYQAIYSALKEAVSESKDIIMLLKELNVGTVILDEAHHLKKSWWQTLVVLLEQLDNIKVISLTATPPYDVQSKEWNNYLSLCGEIDAEISIPQLVKQGDLCPHQDYIYFNYPNEKDLQEFDQYNLKIKKIYDELCSNEQFITAISLNPGVIDLNDRIDYFIKEFDYFISILSFLNYQKIDFSNEDIKRYLPKIPKFDLKQMEVLLTNCLFKDKMAYQDFKKLFKDIKRQLNEVGAIEGTKVNLIYSKDIRELISKNVGKIDSINKIIENEYQALKDDLKLVVITDYIREDIYDVDQEAKIGSMGAIPIFRSIRKTFDNSLNVGVLTGKIVIIPTTLKEDLLNICKQEKINLDSIEITELEFDFDYCKVTLKQGNQRNIVGIITKLFKLSKLQVLIGTSALIGEGWDAPFINSLIMASFVSSFVMSNQIRGRAIRVDQENKNKTASIWHLVCVEKITENEYDLGNDYKVLENRFDTFEGISLDNSRIEKGINRLGINNTRLTLQQLNELNETMISNINNRNKMVELWKLGVNQYIPVKRDKIAYDSILRLNEHKLNRSIQPLISLIVMSLILIGINVLNFMIILNPIIIAYLGYLVYRLIVDRNELVIIRNIGIALMETLYEIGMLKKQGSLQLNKEATDISFFIKEGTLKDNITFNNNFKEMLLPINAPRYLMIIDKVPYPVPNIIGRNINWTNILRKNLKKSFRNVKIEYMRNEEGKKVLLELKLAQYYSYEK